MNFCTILKKTSLALLACSVLVVSSDGLAEPTSNLKLVKVRVRQIHGLGMIEKNQEPAALIDTLNDLSKKLRRLNYQEYKLLDTRTQDVELLRKANIQLADGNILTVKPLYLSPAGTSSRIGMWLHWTDKSGMEILDTRMHFTCGEAMLTGIEHTEKDGRILAIDVTPLK